MANQIATAAINTLRDNHYVLNPVTGVYERSLLLEGARTNAWSFSEDLTNAVWTKTNSTIVASAQQAPDGNLTADKLVEDTTAAAVHELSRTNSSATDNTISTLAFFAKAGERTIIKVTTTSKDGTLITSTINLSSGLVTVLGAGHTIFIDSYINGFFRLNLAWNVGTGVGAIGLGIFLCDGTGSSNYTGDGISGAFVWGLQLEVDQGYCSSYIPTSATAVTRALDGNLIAPFNVTPQAMTAYVRFINLGFLQTPSARLFQIGNSGNNNGSFRLTATGNFLTITQTNETNTGSVIENTSVTFNYRDLIEVACLLYSDGSVQITQSINGAAEVTSARSAALALGIAWDQPNLFIGTRAAGFIALQSMKFALDVQSLTYMRGL